MKQEINEGIGNGKEDETHFNLGTHIKSHSNLIAMLKIFMM